MKLFFVFLLAGLTSISAFSDEPLYRADARGPDSVFNDGFTAPGNNRNLLEHADGLSCTRYDADSGISPTAYVELNERPGVAYVIRARLEVMARTQANPIVWRYEVLPSPADYNVAATFAQRLNATTRINLNTGRVAAAQMRAGVQQTWVATAPVAGNRVLNGRAFTLERGEVVEIPNLIRINPFYVDRPVVRNVNLLPIENVLNGAAEPSLGRRVLFGGQHVISACACGAARAASRAVMTDNPNTVADDAQCRNHVLWINELADGQAFTTLTTPSGLETPEADDERDLDLK